MAGLGLWARVWLWRFARATNAKRCPMRRQLRPPTLAPARRPTIPPRVTRPGDRACHHRRRKVSTLGNSPSRIAARLSPNARKAM